MPATVACDPAMHCSTLQMHPHDKSKMWSAWSLKQASTQKVSPKVGKSSIVSFFCFNFLSKTGRLKVPHPSTVTLKKLRISKLSECCHPKSFSRRQSKYSCSSCSCSLWTVWDCHSFKTSKEVSMWTRICREWKSVGDFWISFLSDKLKGEVNVQLMNLQHVVGTMKFVLACSCFVKSIVVAHHVGVAARGTLWVLDFRVLAPKSTLVLALTPLIFNLKCKLKF